MERRLPSGTSALSARGNELRRRSGQHGLHGGATSESPTLETDSDVSDPHPTYSKSNKKDFPTTKLVSSRDSGSDSRFINSERDYLSTDSIVLGVETPLPPVPEEITWETSHPPDSEDSLSPVLLTPRPGAPSRFPSQDSQASKASQRSAFSMFPRLPTPDFTMVNSKSLRLAMAAPFDFLHVRTRGLASATSSHRATTKLGSKRHMSTSGSLYAPSDTETQLESFPPRSTRTLSSDSTTHSIGPFDDTLHSVFAETARFRFTRKFPSPASVSSFERLDTKRHLFEGMMASESGNDLGVENVGAWTGHKWFLLLSVLTVFGYALIGLVYSILTWFGTHRHAEVMWVTENDILIFITLASTLLFFTGLVGLSGTLLNSRPILAFYALLLWPSFVAVLVVGYTSYKREAFSLDRKLNMAWSQWYDDMGRLLIQESLHCCGFYNPLHEATFSKKCYPRTTLPGCKGKLFRFEKDNLRLCWRLAFSLVPLHILNITITLLCANHVDRRFGKGLTPRAYRLSIADVRANADAVLSQFSTTSLPSEPLRSFSHVTDREDRPAKSRIQ